MGYNVFTDPLMEGPFDEPETPIDLARTPDDDGQPDEEIPNFEVSEDEIPIFVEFYSKGLGIDTPLHLLPKNVRGLIENARRQKKEKPVVQDDMAVSIEYYTTGAGSNIPIEDVPESIQDIVGITRLGFNEA